MKRALLLFSMILFVLPVQACSDTEERPVVMKTVPEIQAVKPEKPVKIKLKRNAKGEYAWEITGDNADKVLESNNKLEHTLRKEK